MDTSVILLDVEGTTTPVNFVYGTLFPFAAIHLATYLHENYDNASVLSDLGKLKEERELESDSRAPQYQEGHDPIPYLLWLISQDRKSPALKSLQGKVWEQGYLSGALKGEVYPDAADAIKRWATEGKRVCIYSSGSVLAQKLLFRYSDQGDLTKYLSAYFDTSVGPKGNSTSYENVARELGVTTSNILFISDVLSELEASTAAGCQSVLVVRPGNKPVAENNFNMVENFESL